MTEVRHFKGQNQWEVVSGWTSTFLHLPLPLGRTTRLHTFSFPFQLAPWFIFFSLTNGLIIHTHMAKGALHGKDKPYISSGKIIRYLNERKITTTKECWTTNCTSFVCLFFNGVEHGRRPIAEKSISA